MTILLVGGFYVITLNTSRIAHEANNQQTAYVLMIGALSGISGMPVNENTIKKEIEPKIPARLINVNLTAFGMGKKTIHTRSG